MLIVGKRAPLNGLEGPAAALCWSHPHLRSSTERSTERTVPRRLVAKDDGILIRPPRSRPGWVSGSGHSQPGPARLLKSARRNSRRAHLKKQRLPRSSRGLRTARQRLSEPNVTRLGAGSIATRGSPGNPRLDVEVRCEKRGPQSKGSSGSQDPENGRA
jgi:hypothetical protein